MKATTICLVAFGLCASFAAGEAAVVLSRGSLLLVRAPDDANVCAALNQDTGKIVGRWKPDRGRCSMATFLWRRAFFVPSETSGS